MTMLSVDKVKIHAKVTDKYDAIKQAGQMLVDGGHVPPQYIEKMIEREELLSTDLGGGLAMPHGTNEAKALIQSTGMAILTIPEGVDFGGEEPVKLVIALAALGDDHMEILTNVASLVSDENELEQILNETSAEKLVSIFHGGS
ncbi:mannitol-specific phosphotransferase enzyme IIA component [Paenibacillus montaniterrae]|uniref:Mannitol-specific phosphotransferase enzyme IIA component n=1 Tax=Paenibacillus montaniterrae TaxID=429341 RepID=A0A920CXR3_9BACL|nr:PTS sugar transporter subunit IIA [Paenibacillus montaniterrae]GIP16595.1 mannitol-specific phosphotransferase enzyme IIA component [Paenibacillus montaniterrae]